MRILFVTPYVPSLIRVRPFNFIKQLSRRHAITLVTLSQGDDGESEAIERMLDWCKDVYVLPISKAQALLNCCRQLLTSTPLQAAYTQLPAARNLIARTAEDGSFDLLHVEHIRGAHLAEQVAHLPRVYDSVDCITRLLKRKLAGQRGVLGRALSLGELLKMRSYEPKVAATFDSVVITSERDKRALELLARRFCNGNGKHGLRDAIRRRRLMRDLIEEDQDRRLTALGARSAGRVAVIRNGVDSNYFAPMRTHENPAEIVFCGKMSYFPNVSGVLRFYHEVFPGIRQERPDVTFKVVGSNPPDAIKQLADDPGVQVTGFVPDIRPHLAAATVVACPLEIGVGIQNKVLEAMAMGKPVVATSVSCEGIPGALDGTHLVKADDSNEMAEAILSLIRHPARGRALGENACRLVRDQYSWEVATRALEAVYEQTVEMRRGRVLSAV